MSDHSKYPTEAGIYKLTCNNNGKIYIGKSVNIRKRLSDHKSSGKNSKRNCHFQNAVTKYGWNSFSVEILEIFENFDKLKDNSSLLSREEYYISLFDSTNGAIGYNKCKYSNDGTGIPLSEEHRAKIGKANLGKILSEETKEKMRQSKLGKPRKPVTEESKEKMRKPKCEGHGEKLRKANLGKILSEETKEKMRQDKLGKSRKSK